MAKNNNGASFRSTATIIQNWWNLYQRMQMLFFTCPTRCHVAAEVQNNYGLFSLDIKAKVVQNVKRTGRQTDRQTPSHTARQTDRESETNRQKHRQTNRKSE